MNISLSTLEERELEALLAEQEADDRGRPVSMPGTGAPVLKIGEGCYLTLPTNPE